MSAAPEPKPRGRKPSADGLTSNPTSEQVRAAREAAGLTQTQAGELIFGARRTWADWEGGQRKMPPTAWHLFLLLTDQHPTQRIAPRLQRVP